MKQCGSCTKCCTMLDVPEINKPSGTPCTFASKDGCTIYETRPQSCRDFVCGYLLLSSVKPRFRPDRCGFIIYPQMTVFGATFVCFKEAMTPIGAKLKKQVSQMANKTIKILWRNPDGSYEKE